MKKLLFGLMLLSLALGSLKAQEETKAPRRKNRIEFGTNTANHVGKIDDVKAQFEEDKGLYLGLYREYQFSRNSYLLYGLAFRSGSFHGIQLQPNSTKAAYKEDINEYAIIVPLRHGLRWEFSKSKSAIEFEFGLYYGRVIASTIDIVDQAPGYDISLPTNSLIEMGRRKENEFGFNYRLAYVYDDHFSIFLDGSESSSYSIAFEENGQKARYYAFNFVFGVGFRF